MSDFSDRTPEPKIAELSAVSLETAERLRAGVAQLLNGAGVERPEFTRFTDDSNPAND